MKHEPQLTFDWHAHDRSIVRMGLALLATLAAIIGLFIIFRVVTPESRQVDVRPQRVVLLNPSVPAERALIHQAMDRSFGMIPSETLVTNQLKTLKMPEFMPSYARHELRLKPQPTGQVASTQKRPFALDMDILPALPKTLPTASPGTTQSILTAIMDGPLQKRSPKSLEIPNVPLADIIRPRFQVAIGRLGQVLVALPLQTSDDAAVNQKLHHFITQMRFTPAKTEIEWGQISFRWVKPKEAKAP